jgi:hypothetical protein
MTILTELAQARFGSGSYFLLSLLLLFLGLLRMPFTPRKKP